MGMAKVNWAPGELEVPGFEFTVGMLFVSMKWFHPLIKLKLG